MNIFRNVTEGISPKEMMIFSGGRQTGKSLYYTALMNRIYDTNLCKEILLPMYPELKYKFSRANWYVAEFDWEDYDEVDKWCEQHFGPHPSNPDAWSRWHHTYSDKIHFAYEKDYVLFTLRWS